MMDIRAAAHALGGDVSNRSSVLCPGPGHSRRDRSLSVTFGSEFPDGFMVYSHANDDFADCRDLVRDLLGIERQFEGRGHRPLHFAPANPDPVAVKKREFAMQGWAEAKPIGGTIAERYLHARGVIIPSEVYTGHAVRFHPQVTFRLKSGEYVRLPAMVAAVVDIHTNEFLALHRTALLADGSGKAQVAGLSEDGRKMLGSNRGGVVKLTPDENVGLGLGIGEGLENSLSVMGNLGFRPLWATLSTSIMAKFPVLSGIEFLTIWADADLRKKNGHIPGIEAARECGARYAAAGVEGEILPPPYLYADKGTDWNDIVNMGRAA
jgi:hypothetical protein